MEDRERWNTRYAARAAPGRGEPNAFLRKYIGMLPRGHALELAMGEGVNAVFLAERGYSVTGIDVSDIAIERACHLARHVGVALDVRREDLTSIRLPANSYELVVCFYYLQRDLLPQIVTTLRPGGMVLYETFAAEQGLTGQPINPAYLLAPNELLEAFRALRIRVYRDVIVEGSRAIVSLIGEKMKRS